MKTETSKTVWNWLWPLLVFAAVWLVARVFWLDGDSGIPSLWEYGYHATDEGFYMSGGKEKYLWGSFADLLRDENPTYGYCSGLHWLSYLAHLCFGLSTWAWRLPPFLVSFFAACVGFAYVRRRSGTGFALAVCTAFSLVPLTVIYERTASNDVMVGAILLLSYVVASGKGVWRIFVSAVMAGAMILVKPSVWVLLPIALSGVLNDRKTRAWWMDAGLFLVVAIAAAYGWRCVVALSVLDEARASGMSPWQVLRALTTHYPLPGIFDFANHFRGLSAFPRDPSIQILAAVSVLLSALPASMALRNLCSGKWNGHLLLYVSVPLYVAAVCAMNTIYTHYFLPVMAMLPIVFSAMREDMDGALPAGIEWRRWALGALAVAGVFAVTLLFVAAESGRPQDVQLFYSRIYNFPQKNVWGFTWGRMLLATVVGTLAVALGRRALSFAVLRDVWAWAAAFFIVASVSFAALPASQLAPYIRQTSAQYFAPLCLNLIFGAALVYSLFAHASVFASRRFVAGWAVGAVAVSYLFTPTWRTAAAEMFRPATHIHAEVAAELAKLLPPDAVVIGERSNQTLFSLPIRTVSTCMANLDPTRYVERLFKRDPNAKVYAFADSQHAYNLQHYKEHAAEYRLELVKTFKMPSFANGQPADVYLCKVIPLRTSGPARGSK